MCARTNVLVATGSVLTDEMVLNSVSDERGRMVKTQCSKLAVPYFVGMYGFEPELP
jgi:hypothetical protein